MRYDVMHPDSTALQAEQKLAEAKGSSLRYEVFKLPQSALCGLRDWPKATTSTIALTAENWVTKTGEKEVPTYGADGITFLNKGGRWIGTKKSYRRPLRAEFTLQSISSSNQSGSSIQQLQLKGNSSGT